MKTIFFLMLISSTALAQELVTSEKDEFTGAVIKETSWEVLGGNPSKAFYFRYRKVDAQLYLELSIMLGTASGYVIAVDNPLMLKFSNDSIIKLYSNSLVSSCYGCGSTDGLVGSRSWGSITSYLVPDSYQETISDNAIVKLRVYTTKAYYEQEIKPKKAEKVKDGIKMILK